MSRISPRRRGAAVQIEARVVTMAAETTDMANKTETIIDLVTATRLIATTTGEMMLPMVVIEVSMTAVEDTHDRVPQVMVAMIRTTTDEEAQARMDDPDMRATLIFPGDMAPTSPMFRSFSSLMSTASLLTGWSKLSSPKASDLRSCSYILDFPKIRLFNDRQPKVFTPL